MGLYNVMFGQSSFAHLLLAVLGLTRDRFYRYRDCHLDEKGRIAVYTRGGGNNRGCYCAPDSDEPDSDERHSAFCPVPLQAQIRQHPCFLFDEDDDFDNTYATFYFSVPEGGMKLRRCQDCNRLLSTWKIPGRGFVTVHYSTGRAQCPLKRTPEERTR